MQAATRGLTSVALTRGLIAVAVVSAAEEALAALPRLAAAVAADDEVSGRLRHEYEKNLRVLRAGDGDAEDVSALRHAEQYDALRLAMIAAKRDTVLRLRDEGRIDDTVLRQLQARLDLEEVRLAGGARAE